MKDQSNPFGKSTQIEWQPMAEGIKRKILNYNDDLMMVRIHFKQGAVLKLHHHFHKQVSLITSGRFEVTVGDKKEILSANDSFLAAPDVVHGAMALEEGEIVDIFTPKRADFL